MKVSELNTTIVDGYIGLLDNLSTTNKLDLISKLTMSIKTNSKKKSSFKKSFGGFDSKNTADEIILEIRNSRVSTRKIEEF